VNLVRVAVKHAQVEREHGQHKGHEEDPGEKFN
jgi:hypothetical protein